MNVIYGLLMATAGFFMLICGTIKSEFVVYKLLVARAKMLRGAGDTAHRFYQVTGLILIVLGGLWAAGIIWK